MLTGLLEWTDARFPLTKMWDEHLAKYYAPKNFNLWYFFGSLALLVLVMQILTGIWLTMYYKPDAEGAFRSVEYIMREVEWGWLIRYMHSTGASAFFIVVYLHMFRGLMYGSYKQPRELIWVVGMLIYGALMAEAFFGYLLPWGQMSFWGAQVIISLFGAIYEPLAVWIRGDYVVSDATLNRFFSLHVVAIPMLLLGLVAAHIIALHEVGSNNPDGVEIKKKKNADGIPLDGIPFHPYYTVKDIMGAVGFLILFAAVVFFVPEFGGWFLESANFVPADPLKTPEHILPVWYFTPYYAILRAIPDKILGVVAMGAAVVILFVIPWLDRHPVRSVRYRSSLFKLLLAVFAVTFVVLGYLGTQPPTPVFSEIGLRLGEIYFSFFLVLWYYSRERSAACTWTVLVFVAVIMLIGDGIRYDEAKAGLMMKSALLPIGFYFVFVFLPMIAPGLNASKPVPERVT
ncbi:MAG: cytochrome bc complex cytochrome b subunit [Ectothiorhodospiraceae bacterium]|nr:cytochrome bc complex cytochrome b subunit [Ectothiorhodospiraceae bacterium]